MLSVRFWAFSHRSPLTAEQKARFCSTTQEASVSVAEAAAAKSASDFYDTNTKRK